MSQPQLTRPAAQAWSFGEFTLDLVRGSLLRGGTEIKLRPKSFELLKYLVLSSGRLVARGELRQALWPDTNVGDDAVAHCLMDVRRALGDAGPDLVKTVPGRGYIFEGLISSVQPVLIERRSTRGYVSPVFEAGARAGRAVFALGSNHGPERKRGMRSNCHPHGTPRVFRPV